MSEYELLKWVHILSASLLFGTGVGTAFHGFFGQLSGKPEVAAVVMRNVVRADWMFTATSGVIQPVTGIWLAQVAGYGFGDSWLVITYALYIIAALCWFPVAVIQVKARNLAEAAVLAGAELPPEYHRLMRIWFILGWPAFLSLVAIFYLMVARPALW